MKTMHEKREEKIKDSNQSPRWPDLWQRRVGANGIYSVLCELWESSVCGLVYVCVSMSVYMKTENIYLTIFHDQSSDAFHAKKKLFFPSQYSGWKASLQYTEGSLNTSCFMSSNNSQHNSCACAWQARTKVLAIPYPPPTMHSWSLIAPLHR